jgi:hypothetical protein
MYIGLSEVSRNVAHKYYAYLKHGLNLESLDLWTLSRTQNLKQLESTTILKLGLSQNSVEGKETPTMLGPV